MKRKLTAILLSIAALFGLTPFDPPVTNAAEPNFEADYTLLDWHPVGAAYWNCQDRDLAAQLITKENKPLSTTNFSTFVSSAEMFTKEDIPVGSIIEIDSGYQYRPEAWKTLSVQSSRPANTTVSRITVDEAWWGDYVYRAFNVSAVKSGTAISDKPEEIRNHLRIYVPKDPNKPAPSSTATATSTAIVTSKPNPTIDPGPSDKSLKILAIGNSFSEDALAHLYNIATKLGYEEVILGNLFIGGCTLATHRKNAEENLSAYTFQKHVKGVQTNVSRSLSSGIKNENWDYITLQQGSGSSGIADTYNDLEFLTGYIKDNMTNPNAKIGWHMTWAYQQGCIHNEFGKYNNDQMTMYRAIINAVQTKVLENPDISFVIPAGTAVQNTRTSYIGDTITRDGYHMSKNLGRYIVGLTWFKTITGRSVDTISWVPDSTEVPAEYLEVIKEAVNHACENPYEVTKSSYPPESIPIPNPVIDYSQYNLLDLETAAGAYWNPTHNTYYKELITQAKEPSKDNFKYFICSGRMFTRDDIPLGSFIEVDPGYQYRADGWKTLEKQTAPRPLEVDTRRVYVNTAWWGEYNYRTFNISTSNPKRDITQETEKTKNSFRIYVPKNAYSVKTEISDGHADAVFTKRSDSQGSDIFVIAAYDSSGRMLKMDYTEKETKLYSETAFQLPDVAPGSIIKAFVLDSFANMKSLSI